MVVGEIGRRLSGLELALLGVATVPNGLDGAVRVEGEHHRGQMVG